MASSAISLICCSTKALVICGPLDSEIYSFFMAKAVATAVAHMRIKTANIFRANFIL